MLLSAAEDFNINLNISWMVGDGENDIKAGINAGCRTALIVGDGTDNNMSGRDFGQDITAESLREFVKHINA